MLNGVDVFPLRLPLLADSVYPVPTLLMLSPGNFATPATAATVVVPERVPLPGFAPSATVTLPVKPVEIGRASCRDVACIDGVVAVPVTELFVWTLKL